MRERKLCFLCDEHEKVGKFYVRSRINEVQNNNNNNHWKVKLQSISPSDVRAGDVKYHHNCYTTYVIRVKGCVQQQEESPADTDKIERVIAVDCGLFSFSDDAIKSMDEFYQTYHCLLKWHGVMDLNLTAHGLKSKTKQGVPDIEFSRSSRRQPEIVWSKCVKDTAVKTWYIQRHAKAAWEKIREVQEHSTPFDGSLQKVTVSDLLYNSVRSVLGPSQVEMLDDFWKLDAMPYIGWLNVT